MPYKITNIILNLEPNKITISTQLQYYTVIPEQIIPPVPPETEPTIIPAYDRIDWDQSVSASCKVDPFDNASLTAARTILVGMMEAQLKYFKRIKDKEYEIKTSGILETLKTNIQARLDLLP